MVLYGKLSGTLVILIGSTNGIPLRHDMGNMSMTINTPSADAQRYFNQGLRFTSAFKFDYAVESQIAALNLDPNCSMCEWGLGLAYGQNLNDALVMALEPWFLDNEPLAYQAMGRAQALLSAPGGNGGAGGDSPSHVRDTALVSALALKFSPTVEEYKSHFVNGLPASLNLAYAEAMSNAAVRSSSEEWPDHSMVLVLSADAWMNLSPWDYWETPYKMRPNAAQARLLLEDAMSRDPDNAWAIHLFTHLMEAGGEAGAAVVSAQRLEYLVPGAPHLQHMQSHVEFRTGQWHEASQANLRAVALPDSDASYPDHNMDMLMWSLGVEGRRTESNEIGRRLTAYSTPLVLAGVRKPLLPPERYLAQEALHLVAFADWEGILALEAPPKTADFPVAVHHFARSLAFIEAKDWDTYRREQGLISAGVERMKGRMDYYGLYNAPVLTEILDILSRAEGLRGGISTPEADISASAATSAADNGYVRRGLRDSPASNEGSNLQARPRRDRGLKAAERAAAATPTTSTAATARHEELELLRQAVELEDGLGYDEPPQLPVPTRVFLGAALLRASTGNGDVEIKSAVEDAADAESVFRDLDVQYPSMGRTLLGLWRACSALGKNDEALEFRQRYIASWRYSEVWLDDSAHVGGRQITMAASAQDGHWTDRWNRWKITATALTVGAALSLAVVAARGSMLQRRKRKNFLRLGTVARSAPRGNRELRTMEEKDPLVRCERHSGVVPAESACPSDRS